jgi:hypothetical protein
MGQGTPGGGFGAATAASGGSGGGAHHGATANGVKVPAAGVRAGEQKGAVSTAAAGGAGGGGKSVRSGLVGLLGKLDNIAEHLCCSLTLVSAGVDFDFDCHTDANVFCVTNALLDLPKSYQATKFPLLPNFWNLCR